MIAPLSRQVRAYFSYEHFYVIYCKFWELDTDHDLVITKADLRRHDDQAISTRMVERIFSGAVTRRSKVAGEIMDKETMNYENFVWFLLSEEDKTTPTAIEFWFRCMDLDGDGCISMYEMEYFFEEQVHRMDRLSVEVTEFNDCLCQMLDMVKPRNPNYILLSDLKRCKMAAQFFNVFFNLHKVGAVVYASPLCGTGGERGGR